MVLSGNSATYTVSNTNDSGSGSLRDAIMLSNSNVGPDIIDFNILPATGPKTISILSQLPALIDFAGVLIDGFTQTGAFIGATPPSTLNLMISIDGFAAGPSHGFLIQSSNNTIQGLAISLFEQDGIRIETTPAGTTNNLIQHNIIGSNVNGVTFLGNGTNQSQPWGGVHILANMSCMGTAFTNFVQNNMISANYAEGVSISSCPPADVFDNHVLGNYLGTDITGTTPMGNLHDGVYMGEGTHDNVVDGNIICDNGYEGVCMIGYVDPPTLQWFTHTNTVSNNSIGVDVNGSAMGNLRDGVSCGIYGPTWLLGHAVDNTIINNTIANNGRNGVMVFEHSIDNTNADANRILQNSMYNNTLLGIDLDDNGLTANDLGDPDMSANNALNHPVITNVSHCNGVITVTGTIDVPNLGTTVIELFRAAVDPTGYGEGDVYLTTTTPDTVGNWSTIVTGVVSNDVLTTTATDATNNTSEFGINWIIPLDFTASETHVNVSCNGGNDGSIDITLAGGVTPYTHVWAHGPTTEDVSGLSAGSYSVDISDNSGCMITVAITLTEPAAINISMIVTDATCSGCSDGAIDATVTGGISPYTYLWDNSATTEDITGLSASTYCLTVTDSNTCVVNSCDTVNEPPLAINEYNDKLFNIYPNPAGNQAYIEINNSEFLNAQLVITDSRGRLIFDELVFANKLTLDLSKMEAGLYFIRLSNNKQVVIERFILK